MARRRFPVRDHVHEEALERDRARCTRHGERVEDVAEERHDRRRAGERDGRVDNIATGSVLAIEGPSPLRSSGKLSLCALEMARTELHRRHE